MTNFDIFTSTLQFESFASVAVSAEKILHIDPSACVLNCRRAMEFAVKWMYSVDKALVMPYQDTLVSLMNTEDFRDIVALPSGGVWILFAARATTPPTPAKRSLRSRRRCVWKTSMCFWTSWLIVTAKTIPRAILTALC